MEKMNFKKRHNSAYYLKAYFLHPLFLTEKVEVQ